MQSLFDVLYKKIVETNEILIKSLGKMMMGGTIMNLKQLEYFSVVAQYGSINKAAQALYVSQPHLSHILQDLEEDIGTALLTRTKKGVQLTEEGRHFLQHSQKILGEMNQLQGLFHKQERSGNTFRVSMTKFSHTMESFIDILNQWSQEPELSFRLNEGSSMDVIADVESGYSDLGVLHFEYTPDSPFPRIFEEKKLEYRHLSEIRPHINDTPPGEACFVSGRGKCFAWHKNQTESTEKRHSAELTSGYVHFRNIGISVCKSNQCGEI